MASAQYAYIKFGLILEKIRNECAYKYCEDKLKTFAQFCRQKLKLTVWQANSYIEAADTAMYLADSGFEILPKNYSQAAVLTKAKKLETGYYQDHPVLEQIWGTLVANTAPEKITANAIEKAIDPDYEEKQSLRLPKRLLARAKIQARLKGMTVEEYLDELMNGDAQDSHPVEPEVDNRVTPEMSQILDEVELQWLEPKSDRITCEFILDLVHKYAAIVELHFFCSNPDFRAHLGSGYLPTFSGKLKYTCILFLLMIALV